jgi:hypothetical protein
MGRFRLKLRESMLQEQGTVHTKVLKWERQWCPGEFKKLI